MIWLLRPIIIAELCVTMNLVAANTQGAVLECSMAGQNVSGPFIVDVPNKTVSTGQGLGRVLINRAC